MNKKFTLRILSSSDIHGSVLAKNYADNSKVNYGLSLLSSAIKDQRNDNTILVDLGDDLQGSPLMYFHQLNRKLYFNPLTKVFNYMGYDYFIPGNHDFNYGLEYLETFVKEINAKTLCSNIYKFGSELLFGLPYDIKEFDNGLKVGVVGLITQYIPNWENPSYIKDLTFVNAFDSIKQTVEELREKVDVLIVAYHGGFERDLKTDDLYVEDTGENLGSKILKNIEGIDVLLTAHQHRYIAENVNNTSVIQGGSRGDRLGVVDINLSNEGNWKVVSKTPKLIKTDIYEEDNKVYDLVEKIEVACQEFLDKKIGNVVLDNLLVEDMFDARLNKHPIVTFINQVQLESSKAMISATSLPNEVTGFSKDITIRNVLSTYIYANTLSVLKVSGKILKDILEKNAEYFIYEDGKVKVNERFFYPKLQHYNYDMFDGIDYTVDLKKEFGNRIVELKYKNKDIKDDDTFSLVVNNYRASGGGDFLQYKKLKVIREIPFDMAELMIDYIIKRHDLYIENTNNIRIIF